VAALALHGDSDGKFGWHVEADEAYIGGKARNMHTPTSAAR